MEEDEEQMELTSQGAGTYWYLPPECFMTGRTPKISSKVDVWSCGVILYQMLYGKRPFGDEMSQEKVYSERTVSEKSVVEFPPKPRDIPTEAKTFITKCLVPDQNLRPDVFTISQDTYLIWNDPIVMEKIQNPYQETVIRKRSVHSQLSDSITTPSQESTSEKQGSGSSVTPPESDSRSK